MGPLGEIFNPGMRHEIEERRSKALRREEEGHGRDSDLRIDLESGFVVIESPSPPAEDSAAAEGADQS
ncbi:hypothetical protein EH165_08255 [Nakamurella antarctica]|uniref:Uncharacterized protein n=1 Tax=Nakamurella antarctica TaxID=1902245 RepID=A0A3G8ZLC9_9ACTN|nr:DUF6191 domain-containing protein [Nakamurella antarctica]AZI58132.1 hypothetical protein EH165_08255 [Nakamurella antarctica]